MTERETAAGSMGAQTITTSSGERLIVLTETDYNRLVEAVDDMADRAAVDSFHRKVASGEEELVLAEIADRILNGENRIRVCREHRGLTSQSLADRTGVAQAFLWQIETGAREGTIETLRKIAAALSLTIDDLVG
ncbi:helix-turn-helix domain-containing protein [Beijerinckia sp. L45]|uniref:helix-turn-helix domain-containing protein n=1 Tax=Beijerinckia sp. L45 TaxID=1641855 RepID=UPI001FF024E3|nr:helix-turn-helix transcriptional regulator [Beijerinckia sp. L45]